VRRYAFRAPVRVSILSERRSVAPWGLEGGGAAACGRNAALRSDGSVVELGGHATVDLAAGDELLIETPGGGGFGAL